LEKSGIEEFVFFVSTVAERKLKLPEEVEEDGSLVSNIYLKT